jgi:hypothetical protein
MTDDKAIELVETVRDLMFIYLAQVEVRHQALEHILLRKGIILSSEEIENEQEHLLKNKNLEQFVEGYDSQLDLHFQACLRYRESKKKARAIKRFRNAICPCIILLDRAPV